MNRRPEDLYELLALQSTEGLSAPDSREAARLMTRYPEVDSEDFDRAAAALHLALLGPESPLPRSLEGKVIAAGERFVTKELAAHRPPRFVRRRAATLKAPGWWAAAAVLAIAVIGWWPQMKRTPGSVRVEAAVAAPSLDSLLEDPRTLRLAWSATEDATSSGATGEVVWNNDRQAGFMRFSGLAANEPTDYQYQLWIFDKTRDERYPVDGGVFDVTAGALEIVVPIDARIRVGDPYLFAVTVEPPGGVVVSTRERIALVAEPS